MPYNKRRVRRDDRCARLISDIEADVAEAVSLGAAITCDQRTDAR